MENVNYYKKMMDLLTDGFEKVNEAFKAAFDEEPVAQKRLNICKDYAQAISGLGVVMSTVNLMRPLEEYTQGGFGLGTINKA